MRGGRAHNHPQCSSSRSGKRSRRARIEVCSQVRYRDNGRRIEGRGWEETQRRYYDPHCTARHTLVFADLGMCRVVVVQCRGRSREKVGDVRIRCQARHSPFYYYRVVPSVVCSSGGAVVKEKKILLMSGRASAVSPKTDGGYQGDRSDDLPLSLPPSPTAALPSLPHPPHHLSGGRVLADVDTTKLPASARGLEQTVAVVSNPPSPAVKGRMWREGRGAMPMLRELDRLCGRGLEGVSFFWREGGERNGASGLGVFGWAGWVWAGGLFGMICTYLMAVAVAVDAPAGFGKESTL